MSVPLAHIDAEGAVDLIRALRRIPCGGADGMPKLEATTATLDDVLDYIESVLPALSAMVDKVIVRRCPICDRMCACNEPKAAQPACAVNPPIPMRPLSRWRVLDGEGKLWAGNCCSLGEARQHARDGDKIQRLYGEDVREWRDE